MHVERYELGELRACCYLLSTEDHCIIIDPADSADFLLEQVMRRNLKLTALIATHGHFDHIVAAGEVQLSFPVPFYINPHDQFLLKRVRQTARHFLEYEPTVIESVNIRDLLEGKFELPPFSCEVLATPGHTPGGCSLWFRDEGVVFTGDTLFKGAIGRYDFSYSDKQALESSVRTLLRLPTETVVYPGHGEATSIATEQNALDYFV